MKKFFVLGLCLSLFWGAGCKKKEPKTSCLYGDNIPEEELNGILQATDQIINFLEGGQIKEIYELGTDEMKSLQTRDQFQMTIDLFFKAFGPMSFPKLQEAYFMTSEAKEEQVTISCNLGEPGIDDIYLVPSNRDLSVIVYRISTELELVRVIIQMEKQEGVWRLRSLSLSPATIKNRLYDYYLDQGDWLRENNLLHVAVLYYKTAILLSDLTVNCEEFTVRAIEARMLQVKTDYLPSGDVQIWAMPSRQSYKVYNVATAYDNGNLLVHVSYLNPSLENHEQLEKQAREIAAFLDQKFPEYRLGFDGFRITAASEKKEEQLMAYHSVVMMKDLPVPAGIPQIPAARPMIKPGREQEKGPTPSPAAGKTPLVRPPSIAPGLSATPTAPPPPAPAAPTTPLPAGGATAAPGGR